MQLCWPFLLLRDAGRTRARVSVAGTETEVKLSPAVAPAISGITFSFPGGAGDVSPDLPGQNLALTMTASRASVTTSGSVTSVTGNRIGTFTAATTFDGFCVFNITASTFPAGSPLSLGHIVTISPCKIKVGTAGAAANGVTQERGITMLMGGIASGRESVRASVNAGGLLTVNGTAIGTVTH